jgi:hypothetical protein
MTKSSIIILVISISILVASCIYLPSKATTSVTEGATYVTQTWDNMGSNNTTPGYSDVVPRDNVEVYFPRQPHQDPAPVLAYLYGNAQGNLDIAIYSLTNPTIVRAIGDAYKRGVNVRIITDRIQSAGATQKHAMNDLITIGVPIKTETHAGLMHLKMSIIDSKVATTGSYNYSKAASEDNDEMFLVIKEVWFAQICEKEFNRMWNSPQFVDLGLSY